MTTIRLSPPQRKVVDHGDGGLLVLAGPGSGKTRVLTERVRRLLNETEGHFRVLALTFTNKAAAEMQERLRDLGDSNKHAFIGTLHGFALQMLTDRGTLVGVSGQPQIFEQLQDRRQILLEAVLADPTLSAELDGAADSKDRNRILERWLQSISTRKAHPLSSADGQDLLGDRILEAYNAGLRACGAYDFDDLLLLSYRLLSDYPKVADFYRRLYKYVCIDEAQDLNEAQYSLIKALCGDDYRNVMMVGDPKQSIYGFNTSSPEYMEKFILEFEAQKIELTENFRSSKSVVKIAQALVPSYMVEAQLPIMGDSTMLVGRDEEDEAKQVVDALTKLLKTGHPDIEGTLTGSRCAVLARTRYSLLSIEKILKERGIAFYRRVSAGLDVESQLIEDLLLALRVVANPKDRLHLSALVKRWKAQETPVASGSMLVSLASVASNANERPSEALAVIQALHAIYRNPDRPDIAAGITSLREVADSMEDKSRRALYEDTEVLALEWDHYLRGGGPRNTANFLNSVALGTSRPNKEGIALLTVHSAKGLEFDVVFLVGMADGVFPDYRARGNKRATEEERRNAFVAVTRSKRLLYLSYPQTRVMPWGETWQQNPSPYLKTARLVT